MAEYFQVFITTPTQVSAKSICQKLLRERLIACAQIFGPLRSSYWWGGEINRSKEWLCIVKTDRRHYRKMEDRIKQLHPYEIPEIIGLPIVVSLAEYRNWLKKELPKNRESRG